MAYSKIILNKIIVYSIDYNFFHEIFKEIIKIETKY